MGLESFHQHAAVLGDQRLAQPANARQRDAIVAWLQRGYGNLYVQRLIEYATGRQAHATHRQAVAREHVAIESDAPRQVAQRNITEFISDDARTAHDAVIAELGGERAKQLMGHGEWTDGHPGRDFTEDERAAVDEIGNRTGCHACGSKSPGTSEGHFIPDHQPPDSLPDHGATGLDFRFYPHCKKCATKQAGTVTTYGTWMKVARNRTDRNWAEGISSDWFWEGSSGRRYALRARKSARPY